MAYLDIGTGIALIIFTFYFAAQVAILDKAHLCLYYSHTSHLLKVQAYNYIIYWYNVDDASGLPGLMTPGCPHSNQIVFVT